MIHGQSVNYSCKESDSILDAFQDNILPYLIISTEDIWPNSCLNIFQVAITLYCSQT